MIFFGWWSGYLIFLVWNLIIYICYCNIYIFYIKITKFRKKRKEWCAGKGSVREVGVKRKKRNAMQKGGNQNPTFYLCVWCVFMFEVESVDFSCFLLSWKL